MTQSFLLGLAAYLNGLPPFANAEVAGPYWQQAPAGVVEPFCVYFCVGSPIEDWFTNRTSIEQARIQFSVFHTDNSQAFLYANQLRQNLIAASIPLVGGAVLGVLPAGGVRAIPVPVREKAPSGKAVYHVAADYRFYLQP